MALDENNHRLFVACRNSTTLRVINVRTGKHIQSISCSGDADDVFMMQEIARYLFQQAEVTSMFSKQEMIETY